MGFFDTLKDKATDLAQAGVAQSKRLAEIAKLKTDNMAQEDAIKKGYIELGKLYYAEKGAAPEGAYSAACEKITAAKAAIEANNDRIDELKDAGDEDPEIVTEADIEPETVDEEEAEPSEDKTEASTDEADPKTED
jgi:hypothetical protein